MSARIARALSASGPAIPDGADKATVAAGCFWGVEHIFRKHFGNGNGLLDTAVGYTGGDASHPSYKTVCSGATGRTFPFPLLPSLPSLSYSSPLSLYSIISTTDSPLA